MKTDQASTCQGYQGCQGQIRHVQKQTRPPPVAQPVLKWPASAPEGLDSPRSVNLLQHLQPWLHRFEHDALQYRTLRMPRVSTLFLAHKCIPPAPKVPRRGRFRSGSNRTNLSDWYRHQGAKKVYGTVAICAFCRSAQNRPNALFRPNIGQAWGQLRWQGPNFGPT